MTEESAEFSLWDPGNVGSYPGRVERVRPGDRSVTILDARQTDDRKAGIVTVMLVAQPAATLTPNVQPLRAPTARIEWGISGGRDFVEVDFLHGQALSITATFIRVIADFPLAEDVVFGGGSLGAAFGETNPADESQVLLLGAMLGAQPHPTAALGATPRLTTFAPISEAGAVAFVPVPKHAQSVTALAPSSFGAVNIAAFTIDDPAALLYDVDVNAAADINALPIARGVEFVRVAPAGEALAATEADPSFVALLWTIGL